MCNGEGGARLGDSDGLAFCGVCGLCGEVWLGLGECGRPTMRLCRRLALSETEMFSPLLAATVEARLRADASSDGWRWLL